MTANNRQGKSKRTTRRDTETKGSSSEVSQVEKGKWTHDVDYLTPGQWRHTRRVRCCKPEAWFWPRPKSHDHINHNNLGWKMIPSRRHNKGLGPWLGDVYCIDLAIVIGYRVMRTCRRMHIDTREDNIPRTNIRRGLLLTLSLVHGSASRSVYPAQYCRSGLVGGTIKQVFLHNWRLNKDRDIRAAKRWEWARSYLLPTEIIRLGLTKRAGLGFGFPFGLPEGG